MLKKNENHTSRTILYNGILFFILCLLAFYIMSSRQAILHSSFLILHFNSLSAYQQSSVVTSSSALLGARACILSVPPE